jgi:glycosyltransferase involved in cell wall biosynthesis
MWLVGYLFNNNGMGTWCWEAAHALASAGESVTLVCSTSVQLPGHTDIPLLRVDPPPMLSVGRRVLGDGGLVSRHGPRVMRHAVAALARQGRQPHTLLLNSTEFLDASIPSRQFVVAWARGVTLTEYITRYRERGHDSARESLRAAMSTLGWWRRDWNGYRGAHGTLAVCTPLLRELQAHGVKAALVYPCTHVPARPRRRDGMGTLRLVMAAADLNEPRKRVKWMLDALAQGTRANATLTLIGHADDDLRAAAARVPFPASFVGAMSRDAALQELRTHDVFLFASLLDDWGYVLTEAMANGLAVVAPDSSPFDEILGSSGARYAVHDPLAFLAAVNEVSGDVEGARQRCWERARDAFSRDAFLRQLRDAVGG